MDELLNSAALAALGIGGAIALVAWTTTWLDERWARRAADRAAAARRAAPSADEAELAAALRDLEAELDRLAAALQRVEGRP
ncbi:MAG: hypothetical protein IPN92_07145 [Chromatiaceae bacterium]|nr:hypothetical protein [Chromatiaceae bacterium]